MKNTLKPRDFRAPARILAADYRQMLAHDPKAFDCLIFPALGGREETIAANEDVVGALDDEERAQTYGEPVQGRAMIIPDSELSFDVLAGEVAQNFLGASAPMNFLLSMPVRRFSLVQWLEYAEPEDTEPQTRTVYVMDVKAAGRVAGAGTVYVCAPMPALGEVPEHEEKERGDVVATANPEDKVGVL